MVFIKNPWMYKRACVFECFQIPFVIVSPFLMVLPLRLPVFCTGTLEILFETDGCRKLTYRPSEI